MPALLYTDTKECSAPFPSADRICEHTQARRILPHLALFGQISIAVQYSSEHPQCGVS